MRQRQRKFVGTLACVGFLIAYCLVAMAIGGRHVVGLHPLAEAAYFVTAGLAWLPPVMLLVRWMSRPDI